MMLTLFRDVRYGARTLARNPGFALVAALTLSLAIGANTTIFSFLHALLFRPLPAVSQPEQLAFLSRSYSYLDYRFFRENAASFSGLFAQGGKTDFQLDAAGESDVARGELVTSNYFSVLGVGAALGRTFHPEEHLSPGAHPEVVISHGLWQRRFGGDSSVLGRTIRLNGFPFTVIGVTPPAFIGNEVGLLRDLWVPLTMQAQVSPHSGVAGPDALTNPNFYWLNVVGRLSPGTSVRQAEAELSTLLSRHDAAPRFATPRQISLYPVTGGLDPRERAEFLSVGAILFVLVGMVLLIACANIANILLARAFRRRKEIGIRLALGCHRSRLVAQLLAESLPLALLGGGGGLVLALWAGDILSSFEIPGQGRISVDSQLNGSVLLFTLFVSLAAVLLFALIPSLQSVRLGLLSALKDDSPTHFRRSRLAGILVVAQVSLSLVLLVCAGLFLHSLVAAGRMNPGFAADSSLVIPFRVLDPESSLETNQSLFTQTTDRAASVPGVVSASLARVVPLGGERMRAFASREGDAPARESSEMQVGFNIVAPRYFETIGLPLLRGREFASSDTPASSPVVVINQTLAARLWPGENPVGKRLLLGGSEGSAATVVGLAPDALYERFGESPLPFLYRPLTQSASREVTLIVRTAPDPRSMHSVLQKELAAEPRIIVFPGHTLRTHLDASLSLFRLATRLLLSLGLVALAMAAVGIFGVIAHAVSHRTREIGIRMALGATPREVLKLILREGMGVVGLGVVVGFFISVAAAQLLSGFLIGIGSLDPAAFLGVSTLLVAVALLACWLPARRATRTDPLTALRYE